MSESEQPASTDKIYLEHARRADQLADMEDIARRGICFMCPEHIPEFYEDRGKLILEGQHSFLVHNGYPYENTKHHLMMIPKEHITSFSQISADFWSEVLECVSWLEDELEITGGAVAMRFGNPPETGASAHHLHLHLIVPQEGLGPEDTPVHFRMSQKFDKKIKPGK